MARESATNPPGSSLSAKVVLASADDAYTSFKFCALPSRPVCSAAAGPPISPGCKGEVDTYVALIAQYRRSMMDEVAEAVRDANSALEPCPM